MSEQEFTAHRKYYNSKGEEIPSVTTVLKLLNKKGLLHWANYLGFKRQNHERVSERAAKVGTLVHKELENILSGDTSNDIILDQSIEDDVEIIMNNFKKWCFEKNVIIKPIHLEKSFTSDICGGTVDFIGELAFDGFSDKPIYVMVDFKTSKKPYSTYFLQLGGYLYLLKENDINLYNSMKKAGILAVNKNKVIYEFIDDKQFDSYIGVFLQLLKTYTSWGKLLKDDWGEDIN